MSDFQDKQIRRKNQSEKIDRIYIARGISGIRINPQFSDSLEGIQFSRSSEILFSLSHSLLGAPNLGKTLTHFPPITKSHLGFMRTRSNMYSLVGCFGGGNAKDKCYFFGTKERGKNLFKSCFSCLFLAFRINWFSKRQHTLKLGPR